MPRQYMRIGGVGREIAIQVRARYPTSMKRSTLKLATRRETLRVLAGLELVHVAGGNLDAQEVGTVGPATGCPLAQAAAQPAKP